MKVFFQTLLPKASRAETPDAQPGGVKPEERAAASNAVRQRPGASGKPAPSARGEDPAGGGSPSLALEAGDFIDRVPHHLLRLGQFDLHQPLLFDLGEIAERIARGSFTIPLADLLKAMPEMFAEDAAAHHAMDIRFPWQKVMQMVNESTAAHTEKGGETLAQKLRRLRKTDKPPGRAGLQNAPAETKPEGASQPKRGGGRDGEKAWFSKRAITFEPTGDQGEASQEKAASVPLSIAPVPPSAAPRNEAKRSIAAPGVPEVPESAPALFELPESKGTNVSPQTQPAPSRAPMERAVAIPAPTREPVPDIMNLATEPPPSIPSGKAVAVSGGGAPVPGSAKSGVGESDQKMFKTRIAFLEAQLKTLLARHQSEVSTLKTETERLLGKAREEKEKERVELMDQFQFERQRLAAEKAEQLARMEAEYRAGVAAQQSQISQLRAADGEATGGERRESAADLESRQAELKALEARIQPLVAELESVKAEREQVAGLLSQEERRADELAARLEFDLFALRVESAQIVADEREKAQAKIAELESQFARERAEWQNGPERVSPPVDHETTLAARDREIAKLKLDCANHANAAGDAKQALARLQADFEKAAGEQLEARRRSLAAAKEEAERGLSEARAELERERQQVMAERQQILRDVTARAGTSVAGKDEALASLQAELEKAEALAVAQAAAHEGVAAQWEDDIQAYRKRIQVVIGEKAALAAKLRAAEIALQAAGGSMAGTAA